MKLFVESLVTLGENYLIPCNKISIFEGVLVVYDEDNDMFEFDLHENEFLIVNHDPVE